MLIQRILMSPEVAEKIKYKHGLDPIVAKDVLEGYSSHCIEKVGGGTCRQTGRYISIREREDNED